jgi:hypothetical protein
MNTFARNIVRADRMHEDSCDTLYLALPGPAETYGCNSSQSSSFPFTTMVRQRDMMNPGSMLCWTKPMPNYAAQQVAKWPVSFSASTIVLQCCQFVGIHDDEYPIP